MTDIKPLSHGYYHSCRYGDSNSHRDWLNDDECDRCLDAGEDEDRCPLDCKLCRLEDPEILIPLGTGQMELLRSVLKDLWYHIDVVLDSKRSSVEKKLMARELSFLLTNCKRTREYLDME